LKKEEHGVSQCHRVRRFVALFGALKKEEHGVSRHDIEGDEDEVVTTAV
jgi:hypothetical protein